MQIEDSFNYSSLSWKQDLYGPGGQCIDSSGNSLSFVLYLHSIFLSLDNENKSSHFQVFFLATAFSASHSQVKQAANRKREPGIKPL